MRDTLVRNLGVGAALAVVLGCEREPQREGQDGARPQGSAAAKGYILQPDEGELLVPCPAGNETAAQWADWRFNIKVDSLRSGTTRLAMGTASTPPGQRISVHRHEYADEILFVHKGDGVGIVGDERVPLRAGSTIYIPQGVWHGVENGGREPMEMVFVVSPPGLEKFFRETSAPPGRPCPRITDEQMQDLLKKHGYTGKAP